MNTSSKKLRQLRRQKRLRSLPFHKRKSCRILRLEPLEPRVVLAPIISEFMADNESSLQDGDGQYSDWIELHNPDAAPVNLIGWHLTDDSQALTKWTFPDVSIDPGGYLVVFASGQSVSPYVDAGGFLHTDFSLDSDGEYLALVENDGQTIASEFNEFPRQIADASYGVPQLISNLVDVGAAGKFHVPANDALGSTWVNSGFDDSGWTDVTNGFGFEVGEGQGAARAFWNNAGNVGSQAYGGSLGLDFDVLEPITVTQLGVFDSGSDGLAVTITSQLWSRNGNSGSLLTGLAFTPADPGELIDGDRYKDLVTPLVLQPGTYTVVGYGYGASELNGNTGGPAYEDRNTDDGGDVIAFVGGGRYGTAGAFPVNVDAGPVNRYSAGTFAFQVAAYTDEISSDIEAEMHDTNASSYARIDFDVQSAAALDSLVLQMKYDDGFVAYLNGTEITRRNAPAVVGFDSTAESGRPLELSVQYESINITDRLNLLNDGTNTLAIHGLNVSSSDNDFLIVSKLTGSEVVVGQPTYFDTSTPLAPNDSTSTFSGFVEQLGVTVEHGIYDSPFQVELTTPTANAEIRFTLDGSTPTESTGQVYSGPIDVDGTMTLRAAAFEPGLRQTDVVTRTYLFLDDVFEQTATPAGFPVNWNATPSDYEFEQNPANLALIAGDVNFTEAEYKQVITDSLRTLPTMSIVLDVDDFVGVDGLYSNPTQRSNEYQRAASVEYFFADGSDGFTIGAGLQVMGGSSRSPSLIDKHSLRLVFKNEYGPGRLNYPFFEDTEVSSFNTIALRANARDTWPAVSNLAGGFSSYIRDQWAKDSLRDINGQSTSGNFVHLYVNGLYWGLYNPTERPDSAHAESHLGGNAEDYDVVKFCCPDRVVDGSIAKWNELLALANAGLGGDAAYQFVQGNNPDGTRNPNSEVLLDVDNLIEYVVAGQYHASVDWPGNYFVMRERGPESEGFQFFTWDNDLAFVFGDVNRDKTRSDNNSWWTESPGVLDIALRDNAEYRLRFADRVRQEYFDDGNLTPQAAAALWTRIADEVRPALAAESARWGDSSGTLYTLADWDVVNATMVVNYFPFRSDIVLNQLRGQGLYPNTEAPGFFIDGIRQYGGEVNRGAALTMQANAGTLYYTLDGTDPRLVGGAVDNNALIYDGTPLTINQSTRVRARLQSAGGEWSAISDAVYGVVEQLRITELNYNPIAPTAAELIAIPGLDSDDFEFIELVNDGGSELDVTGYHFEPTVPVEFIFPGNTTLQVGERVLVVRDVAAFELRYGTGLNIAGEYSGKLSNGGEEIVMLDAVEAEVFRFTYDDDGAWPGRADGNGSSIEVIDRDGDYNDPQNWRSSNEYGGSPDEIGTGPISDVVINEVLSHTDLPQLDTIELFNASGVDINIGGWLLSDSNNNYAKFAISGGTMLPIGQYISFDESDFNPTPMTPGPNHFALDAAHGDDVWLLATDALGNPIRFADRVEVEPQSNGESWGRWPNGTGDLYPQEFATIADENSGPRVGPVVLSEIMYAPVDLGSLGFAAAEELEFIEIHNPTAAEVNLTNWALTGGVNFSFPDNQLLAANSYLVVLSFDPLAAENSDVLADFKATYTVGENVVMIGGFSGRLDNSGERIRLRNPDGPPLDEPDFFPMLLQDEVRYDSLAPWPDVAQNDRSLTRVSSDAWGNTATSWLAFPPTPGAGYQDPPRVLSFEINLGFADPVDLPKGPQPTSWAQQRSDLRSLVVTFSKDVQLSNNDLVLTNLGVNAPVEADVTVTVTPSQIEVDGAVLTISFAREDLQSGAYQLDVLPSVTDFGGVALDGDGDGQEGGVYSVSANEQTAFYELTSNYNGDTGVSVFDFTTFSYWFGNSVPRAPVYADPSGDGGVSVFDFTAFSLSFGVGIVFPAAFAAANAPDSARLHAQIENNVGDIQQVQAVDARLLIAEPNRRVEILDLALLELIGDSVPERLQIELEDLFDEARTVR